MKTPTLRHWSAWIVCLLLFFQAITISAQTNLQEKLPIDPHVKKGTLKNGLTYYIRKNSKPENKVELRLVVNAGSILEDDDQLGLAHFTEHMAFNGSKNFQKNDLVSFLQSIGVEFGADLNAYTSFDETVYILPIPTDKKENLDKAFQILEDWASTVSFADEEIDKERGVVLEESRIGKGANDRMNKIVYPKVFAGSRYADRLPIGKEEVLSSFKYDVIKRFYKDWYRPDLMAVIVVGDIEPSAAEAYIKKHFEHLKNPSKPRPRTYATIPAREKSEGVVATDKEATHPILQILYSNEKARPMTTLADYREHMLRRLFTSMLSQRFQELTQKADPPFIFGGSSIGGFVRGYEAYSAFAVLGPGGPEKAINAIVQENERAKRYGFTEAELDRTKKTLMRGMERSYNERDKTESERLVQEYINNYLENEPIPGIENEYKYHQDLLDKITLKEVNDYAAKTIPGAQSGKLIVFQGPEQLPFKIPTGEELLALAEKAAQMEVKPFEEKAVATALLESAPTPGKIAAETENKDLGTTELTLGNGVKVILKPTDFKNDQVVMTASRPGGQYLYDVKDRYNAEYAAAIVGQMGVGEFSPLDLQKVLAGKTASVSPRLGTISEGLNGQSSANDVEIMLQLTYLYFTQPRVDAELFSSFVTRQQALYQNLTLDPSFAFQDTLFQILYKGHPWSPRLPRAETFTQVDLNRAMEIYKERFGNANGFTFVLVGKFDLEAIKPLIATYLGSLPSSSKSSSFKDIGLRPETGPIAAEVKKGTEPKSMVRLLWNGEARYTPEEQLKLQALADLMNIKLIETLREEMSGVYGAGMYASLNKRPYGHYSIGISVPCGPDNVEKLISASLQEIEKVKTNGPSAEDLAKVKQTWKQQYLVNVKDNSYWARHLIQSIEEGTDPNSILSYEKRVDALTPEDVKSTANKYLDSKKYVRAVLNPVN